MLFAHLAILQRQRLNFVADQKARPFIKANHRVEWIIGLCIQPQDALHLRNELRIDLPDTPGLLEMWLQLVFFSMLPTWLFEMLSQ